MRPYLLALGGCVLFVAGAFMGYDLGRIDVAVEKGELEDVLFYGAEHEVTAAAHRQVSEFVIFEEALSSALTDIRDRPPIPVRNKHAILLALAESQVMTSIPRSWGLGAAQDADPSVRRYCAVQVRSSCEAIFSAMLMIHNSLKRETDPDVRREKLQLLVDYYYDDETIASLKKEEMADSK